MDIYHIWCDLKPGVQDTDFTDAAKTWLEALSDAGYLAAFRITRRKLGLGGPTDFHLMLEFENLDSLDKAFHEVATRSGPVESFSECRAEITHPDPERAVFDAFSFTYTAMRERILFPESIPEPFERSDDELVEALTHNFLAYLGSA